MVIAHTCYSRSAAPYNSELTSTQQLTILAILFCSRAFTRASIISTITSYIARSQIGQSQSSEYGSWISFRIVNPRVKFSRNFTQSSTNLNRSAKCQRHEPSAKIAFEKRARDFEAVYKNVLGHSVSVDLNAHVRRKGRTQVFFCEFFGCVFLTSANKHTATSRAFVFAHAPPRHDSGFTV